MGKARDFLKAAQFTFVKNSPLSWACVVSIALLVFFGGLQIAGSPLIQLPVQWLWISVLPILLTLLVGGYIGKFKGAGFEFEPGMRLLPYAQPGRSATPAPPAADQPTAAAAKSSTSAPVEAQQNMPWQNSRDAEYARTGGLFIVHVYKRDSAEPTL